MALVLTLMITVLITAMVVEFSYGVYTTTSALHNWKDSQRLSFVSRSGIALAAKTMNSDIPKDQLYRFPGKMEIPVENILEGFTGTVIVSVEDENARFNLNSLRLPDSLIVFKRLLKILGLDERIGDRIADWIDPNTGPRLSDSKEGAKNAYMDSVDELLLIKGIDRQTYEALLPYVTVYGYNYSDLNPGDRRVNVNTASIPVIMSLGISKEQAEEIVNYRKLEPFTQPGDLDKTGLDPAFRSSISQLFTTDPPMNFRITSVAEENRIKRVIETVVTTVGLSQSVRFWREM
jgi:type II secretory pathway component PulK